MKRKIAPAVMIVLIAALVWPRLTHASQNGAISLTLEAGYDGFYRSGQWLPVAVNLSNSGPDLSGELRVLSSDGLTTSPSAYATPIELPLGSAKRVFIYIPLSDVAQQVRVELVTSDQIVASGVDDVRPARESDMLFAVITESPRGTIDLTNIRSGIGSAFQTNWQLEDVPELGEALRGLDALILTDADTGKFSTRQRQAIEQWVLGGGHLVVTGGPNWQKTQAGVTPLLPVQPNQTTTLTSMPRLADFAGKPGTTLEASTPVIVTEGVLLPNAEVLVSQSNIPLLTRHAQGGGIVDYLAVDPGLEPFQSWADRGQFWFTLLTTSGQRPSWSNGIVDSEQALVAADFIKGLRLPDVFQLGLFLFLYVLIIGPINYLVLRQIRRRELAWLTIPLIVIGASVVYYVTGFNLRGTQAIVNRMALVQVWPGSERAQVDSVIGVLAPRRGIYNLDIGGGMTLRSVTGDTFGSIGPSSGVTIYEIGNYQARSFPVDAGTTAAFAASGYTEVKPLEGQAEIQLGTPIGNNQRNLGTRIIGSVTNTTGLTLQNVIVLAMGGTSSRLGTLNPGDSAAFEFNMLADESPPVSLGNGSWLSTFSSRAYRTSVTARLPDEYATVRDLMDSNYTNTRGIYSNYAGRGYENTPTRQEMWRRQAFLEALAIDSDPSGGRGTDVFVAGWTNESPVPIGLEGAPFETEDTTLYVYRLPVAVRAIPESGVVDLPNAYLTWTPTERSTRRDIAPYDMQLQPGDKLVFRFTPMPLMRLSEVTRIGLLSKEGNAFSSKKAQFSLWNWTTGQWEKIEPPIGSSLVSTITDRPSRFVGPENALELMIEPIDNSTGITYDRVELLLSGRLAGGG